MREWYREDLAYIHGVGCGDYALDSGPGILELLAWSKIRDGVGGRSGLRERLVAARARQRTLPRSRDRHLRTNGRHRARKGAGGRVSGRCSRPTLRPEGPLRRSAKSLTTCSSWPTISQRLIVLFARVYDALPPGGAFVFDVVEPGQVPPGTTTREFYKGEHWVVLVEQEYTERGTLTR
jgi:hypothetical protein